MFFDALWFPSDTELEPKNKPRKIGGAKRKRPKETVLKPKKKPRTELEDLWGEDGDSLDLSDSPRKRKLTSEESDDIKPKKRKLSKVVLSDSDSDNQPLNIRLTQRIVNNAIKKKDGTSKPKPKAKTSKPKKQKNTSKNNRKKASAKKKKSTKTSKTIPKMTDFWKK